MNFPMTLIDCYSIEYSCFIIGGEKIISTFEDVAKITDFSIDGKLMTGFDYKLEKYISICSELLLSSRLF